MIKAYQHFSDGLMWLRIENTLTGDCWDESISGWSLSINLTNGETLWKHKDGRVYNDMAV